MVVPGRIDGALANELEVEILAQVRAGAKNIYINLGEANFLCSAGLRVLLQYWRQLKKDHKGFWVTKPAPEVDVVLRMTGFRDQMVEGAQPR